jgi:hypothetical protein
LKGALADAISAEFAKVPANEGILVCLFIHS